MKRMTMRERMLAVVRLEEHDRAPFVQYSGLAGPDVHRIETPEGRLFEEERCFS